MSLYLKKFQTTAQYNAYTADTANFILPNVSVCEDAPLTVHYNPYIPPPPQLYDYLYEDLSYGAKDTTKTAIGVCVIPANVLPDGKARFISLNGMTLTSPNVGGSDTYMYWGAYKDIQTLPNFFGSVVVTGDTSAEGTSNNGYLPLNGSYRLTPHIPSPIDYFSAYSSTGITSDFDGKSNTEKILAVDNAGSTAWQTAESIENTYNSETIHPAAQCCWRFNPGSTNQGDWYLPSIGELGFIFPNFDSINAAIGDVGGHAISIGDSFWSSNEAYYQNAWTVNPYSGAVKPEQKGNYGKFTRAFMTL